MTDTSLFFHPAKLRGGYAGSSAQGLVMQVGVALSHLRAGMCHQLLEFVHGNLAGAGQPCGKGVSFF